MKNPFKIKTKLRVLAWGSSKNFESYQNLVKSWYFMGIKLHEKIVDTEEIPSWARIQAVTLGSTEWRSKWYGMEGVIWRK